MANGGITISGIGSPATLQLQDFDKRNLQRIDDRINDLETSFNETRGEFAAELNTFDKNIQLGLNLVGSLQKDLDLNQQDYRFGISNLQEGFENTQEQNLLDFETKMKKYAFDQEGSFIAFQSKFDELDFTQDKIDLRLQKDIDVINAQLNADLAKLREENKGIRGQLLAQIEAAKVGQRTQREIQASLERTRGLVDQQGILAIRQAGVMARMAYIQERTARGNQRYARFRFEEARAINRAIMDAEGGLAESPITTLIGETAIGAQFERETEAIIGDIETAKERRQSAAIRAEQSKLQVAERQEGIGRQITQSKGREKQLGYAIQGYRARLAALGSSYKASEKRADDILKIQRQYAKDVKARSSAYYDTAKGHARALYNMQQRQIKVGKALTEENYALTKTNAQLKFDKDYNTLHSSYLASQNEINSKIDQQRISRHYNEIARSRKQQIFEAERRDTQRKIDAYEDLADDIRNPGGGYASFGGSYPSFGGSYL